MKLLTPGPVELHPRVLNAMSRKIIHHRSSEARRLVKSIVEDLKAIHNIREGLVAIGAGSGTTSVDSMVWSIVGKSDRVLVVSHGEFGERLASTITGTGALVEVINAKPGSPIDPSLVVDAARGFNVVGIVYNETSTGLLYRGLEKLSKALCGHVDVIMVDAVSAIGAAELYMDEWCIDAVASAPHKALGGPPGIFIVALDKRLINRRGRAPPSIDAVRHAKTIEERSETPYTPPVSLLYGFREALDIVEEAGGIDAWIGIHRERIDALYNSIPRELKPLVGDPAYRSNNIAALETPVDSRIIVDYLKSKGYLIASGMGKLKKRIIRIGVMGYIGMDDIRRVASLLADVV